MRMQISATKLLEKRLNIGLPLMNLKQLLGLHMVWVFMPLEDAVLTLSLNASSGVVAVTLQQNLI